MHTVITGPIEDVQPVHSELEYSSAVARVPHARWLSVGLTFNIAVIGVITALVIGYFIISNHLISQGFTINELEEQLGDFKERNRDLEITAMNLESYETLSARITDMEMVAVGNLEYLEVRRDDVALR